MKSIVFELENCYGIPKFYEKLDFTEEQRAHLIYAPNGTMKTSFADVISDIQNEKSSKDYIYPERPTIRNEFYIV